MFLFLEAGKEEEEVEEEEEEEEEEERKTGAALLFLQGPAHGSIQVRKHSAPVRISCRLIGPAPEAREASGRKRKPTVRTAFDSLLIEVVQLYLSKTQRFKLIE